MSHPVDHARSSAKAHGGVWRDYYAIHAFLDSSKTHMAHARHRALLHHSLGVEFAVRQFGQERSEELVRAVAAQHLHEDLQAQPTPAEWLKGITEPFLTSQRPMVSAEAHAEADARSYRVPAEEFLGLHRLLDSVEAYVPGPIGRLLYHNSYGPFLAEALLGPVLVLSTGREVPVRYLAERHIRKELGQIPSAAICLKYLKVERWMLSNVIPTPERDSRHELLKRS